ncbi:ogr/Delta-like zinc finger family protein [Xenorhabdus miraniensis]|uniref:ogr/Delta-like zinc finger family protein n=1 Tax=Xenorhabdus miraniensis TaxID=351674 RepID=UPI000C042ABE|nr:ogr/Delta-like zinc finger family protein [Xenorhabdus miraniensis]
MYNCPLCKSTAHARSSFWQTEETKERYHQCRNINCGASFVTHETLSHLITKPTTVNKATPHPKKIKKVA